jgi:hypothetical protein
MGVVDFEFYTDVYKGQDADEASFPALCARAIDIIGAVTHWVDESALARLPELAQTLYKKAVCAQIDFLVINGTDSINESGYAGFTVGKVTVHGKATSATGGKLSESISPLAIGYLEQTGLMNPQVPTLEGWW